jgi:hypothetical protein
MSSETLHESLQPSEREHKYWEDLFDNFATPDKTEIVPSRCKELFLK